MGIFSTAAALLDELDATGFKSPHADKLRALVTAVRRDHTKEDGMSMGSHSSREEHESYGALSISTVSGGDTALFGSRSSMHPTRVRIELRRCRRDTSIDEWFHPYGAPLLEVEMTAAQFSEAITRATNHSTPCTIKNYGFDRFEAVVQEKNTSLDRILASYKKEITAKAVEVAKAAEGADAIIDKKTLTKADRQTLRATINNVSRMLHDSLPFFGDLLEETAEKMGSAVTLEAEAAFRSTLDKLGIDALRKASEDTGSHALDGVVVLEIAGDEQHE